MPRDWPWRGDAGRCLHCGLYMVLVALVSVRLSGLRTLCLSPWFMFSASLDYTFLPHIFELKNMSLDLLRGLN